MSKVVVDFELFADLVQLVDDWKDFSKQSYHDPEIGAFIECSDQLKLVLDKYTMQFTNEFN